MISLQEIAGAFGTRFDPRASEVLRYTYWDTVQLPVAAGGTSVQWFQNPLGTIDPISNLPKTLEDTNNQRSAQLSQDLFLKAIRLQIGIQPKQRQAAGIVALGTAVISGFSATYQTLDNISRLGTFQLNVGSTIFATVPQPVLKMPPGGGVEIINLTAVGATTPNYHWQGETDEGAIYRFGQGLLISESDIIRPVWSFTDTLLPAIAQVAGANVRVYARLMLDGYVIRPIQ